MSRSQADKAAIHEKIVNLAAERFREVGINGIGVADLMKEAGRTGGGFYKHFESREKLVEEALECVFEERSQALEQYTQADSTLTLADLVESYLSEDHRLDPGTGCAISALMNDMSRASDPIRALYTREVQSELAVLTSLTRSKQPSKKRAQALMTMCTLVGAIGLARAVNDEELIAELLNTSKTLLKALEA
ncbi:TetR/AcrR family transcriptional regulator [Pseudomonas sp. NA-150]|uniref:TetR/AcrR family transcriptional regulator n=1 Tax=Pseudomonas sp. NA-150 TaxID=3367525 RepID=UPI0037C667F1